MVIVSHDREFLDQVCTKIVDAEGGICTEYNGNYSKFLQLKKGASLFIACKILLHNSHPHLESSIYLTLHNDFSKNGLMACCL